MEQKVSAQVHRHGSGATVALKLWIGPEPLDPWTVGLLQPGFLHGQRVVQAYCCASNKKDGLPQPPHARSATTPMVAIQGLCIGLNLFVAVATEPAWDWPQALHLILVLWPDRLRWNGERGLPAPVGQLGDKADLTPSPLLGSGSNRGCLTGETNDVVRSYGFALTEQVSVTLLMPRRNHCSPAMGRNGAERNRTAVRNTGVSHLVRKDRTPSLWQQCPLPCRTNSGM